jgi:hypothetical protein
VGSLTPSFVQDCLTKSASPLNYFLDKVSLYVYCQLSVDTSSFITWLPHFLTSTFSANSYLVSTSNFWNSLSTTERVLRSAQETSDLARRQRASSPVVGYNFKVGDFYPSTTLKFYPSVFRSLSDVTRGVRRSAWYFSPTFYDLLRENFGNYMSKVAHSNSYPVTDARSRPTSIAHNAPFYNFFHLLASSSTWVNSRWLSINSLDQKFYRMYMSSTMQQRIYTN